MLMNEEMISLREEPQAGEGGDVDEPTSPSAGMMKWIDDDFFI